MSQGVGLASCLPKTAWPPTYRTVYIAKNPHEIYVTDEATGIKLSLLSLPKFGKMVTRKGYRGRYGYMMFVNLGYVVKHDSKVTVTIGDYQKKHVTVI